MDKVSEPTAQSYLGRYGNCFAAMQYKRGARSGNGI